MDWLSFIKLRDYYFVQKKYYYSNKQENSWIGFKNSPGVFHC